MRKMLLGVLAVLCGLLSGNAQYRETRQVIYQAKESQGYHLLNPEESVEQPFALPVVSHPVRTTLRVTGEVKMPVPYASRGEEMFRRSEYLIDDNLDSLIRWKDKYALYFQGDDDDYKRMAWNRIPGEALKGRKVTVSLPVVRTSSLQCHAGGSLGVELALYYEKEGRAPLDVYDEPDSVLFIPVPEGTGKRRMVVKDFVLPEQLACVLLSVGGVHFSGECWLESPTLKVDNKVVWHDAFVKNSQRKSELNYWVGCNLSDRSWPYWEIALNGEVIHRGKIFDRASDMADFYVPMPEKVLQGGTLTLTLKKEPHRAAFPYELRTIELLQEPARSFEVIAVPKYVTKGKSFGILIETNKANETVTAVAGEALRPSRQTVTFKHPGLHVLEFRAVECQPKVKVEISDSQREEMVCIGQVVSRAQEEIYLSSGDEIYIDKHYVPYNQFFKWYIGERVGNWYQFRPSYQWSGVRNTKPEVMKYYTGLLNELQIPYAWQVEGRTLAGDNINPSVKDLQSPMFRGKQAHENDGGYYYWHHFLYQGLLSDMVAKHRPFGGIFAKHRPIYTDHGTFIHYDTAYVRDMAHGADYFVNNLRYSKGESSRHTGPSTMFRYFYQAGYDWVGAEQMYGPEETIMSTLRGASKAYSKKVFGSLHAMQWGSFPFTKPEHALRHYMSLAVAYMHGSSHMNTEEALWTDEYLNDRYTESGKAHLEGQHKILDFIETHSRRGEFHTDIAVVQGRNDSWKSFARSSVWSQGGSKWKFNKAKESFDLLKVFYPNNDIDAADCKHWFTHTPYGSVDVLPVEASKELMKQYRLMIFLGWNTYAKTDFERIADFVFDGGTLVMTAAHINANLQPDEQPTFPEDDAPLQAMLGKDYRSLTQKTVISYGAGRVIYFPSKAYPAEDEIRSAYVEVMKEESLKAIAPERSKGWIDNSEVADFTVWQDGGHRTIYVLNSDWEAVKNHGFDFSFGKQTYKMSVNQGELKTIHCSEGLALSPKGNTTDVLDIKQTADGWLVTIQTTAADEVAVMLGDVPVSETLAIHEPGIHELKINRP